MRNVTFIVAAALAMGLALRMRALHASFQRTVNESLATSEGYDHQFIGLVDHLEEVLTTRASFSYPGGKDPMTGRRREVAAAASAPPPRKPAPAATRTAGKAGKPDKGVKPPAETPPPAPVDRVKLTAIIADDYGQHTAIVMDGERSLSVDVGDMVGNRKVLKITAKDIVMESDSTIYTYGLAGTRDYQQK